MSKGAIGFIGGMLAGAAATMLYLHRDVIKAAVAGEELPEAPASCPFSKCEDKSADECEDKCEEQCEE